jgi:hypothetical protein
MLFLSFGNHIRLLKQAANFGLGTIIMKEQKTGNFSIPAANKLLRFLICNERICPQASAMA